MSSLLLIYVNKLGVDWKGDSIYEFLFSDTTEDVDGEMWDLYPASGNPSPPPVEVVKLVAKLESSLKLLVIQDSDTFAVWDAIDDVVALAWEDITEYDEYPEKRMSFRFGETLKSIEAKLYEQDLKLDIKNKPKNE